MKIYNEETKTLKKKFYGVQAVKLVMYVVLSALLLAIPISAFAWIIMVKAPITLFIYVSIGAVVAMWFYSVVAELADEIEWELSSREEKVFAFRFRW